MRRVFLLILLIAVCVLPPVLSAQSVPRSIRTQWYSGRRYLAVSDIARFYGMAMVRGPNNRYTLSLRNARIVLTVNKRYGSLNGIVVTYLFAPVHLNGRPYISELDFSKVVEPVMRNAVLPKKRIRSIMIDPGH